MRFSWRSVIYAGAGDPASRGFAPQRAGTRGFMKTLRKTYAKKMLDWAREYGKRARLPSIAG
jgi:hypothetical protein